MADIKFNQPEIITEVDSDDYVAVIPAEARVDADAPANPPQGILLSNLATQLGIGGQVLTDLRNDIDGNTSSITNEVANRASEDNALEARVTALITAETANRIAGVSDEEAARIAADDALGLRIDGVMGTGGSVIPEWQQLTSYVDGTSVRHNGGFYILSATNGATVTEPGTVDGRAAGWLPIGFEWAPYAASISYAQGRFVKSNGIWWLWNRSTPSVAGTAPGAVSGGWEPIQTRVETFVTNRSYYEGDIVIIDGKFYLTKTPRFSHPGSDATVLETLDFVQRIDSPPDGTLAELNAGDEAGQRLWAPNTLATYVASVAVEAGSNLTVNSDATLSGLGTNSSPLRVTTPFTAAEKTKLAGLTSEPPVQEWTSGTTYDEGDIVKDGSDCVWVALEDIIGADADMAPGNLITKWSLLSSCLRDWNQVQQFANGEIVMHDGRIWVYTGQDRSAVGSEPDGLGWRLLGGSARSWVSGSDYRIGEIVAYTAPGGTAASATFHLARVFVRSTDTDPPTTDTTRWLQLGGGGVSSVTTDDTLTGDGTSGDPLAVAIPFTSANRTKLGGIQEGAQMNPPAMSAAELDAGTGGDASFIRTVTPLVLDRLKGALTDGTSIMGTGRTGDLIRANVMTSDEAMAGTGTFPRMITPATLSEAIAAGSTGGGGGGGGYTLTELTLNTSNPRIADNSWQSYDELEIWYSASFVSSQVSTSQNNFVGRVSVESLIEQEQAAFNAAGWARFVEAINSRLIINVRSDGGLDVTTSSDTNTGSSNSIIQHIYGVTYGGGGGGGSSFSRTQLNTSPLNINNVLVERYDGTDWLDYDELELVGTLAVSRGGGEVTNWPRTIFKFPVEHITTDGLRVPVAGYGGTSERVGIIYLERSSTDTLNGIFSSDGAVITIHSMNLFGVNY